jgi:hypothetical protein
MRPCNLIDPDLMILKKRFGVELLRRCIPRKLLFFLGRNVRVTFKGQCHEIFDLWFFSSNNPI